MTGQKGRSGGVRPGAGSGGPRPGAGRPTKTFTLRLGEQFYCSGYGIIEVVRLDRKHLTLEIGNDEITLVR